MESDRSARVAHVASIGLVASLPVIIALELDLWPPARAVWGPALWRYLPPPVAVGLAVSLALWAVPAIRRSLLPFVEAPFGIIHRSGRWARLAMLAALAAVFFALSPDLIFGDSRILHWAMHTNPALFFFPDVGATFFLQAGFRVGEWAGLGGRTTVEILASICAPIVVVGLARAARALAPDARAAGWIVAFAIGTGLLRVFAGHIEVYAYVLAAAALYLWASVAHLKGRAAAWVVCLAYGLGVWVHLQFLFLGPSLLFVLFARDFNASADAGVKPTSGDIVRRLVTGGAVSLTPMLLFFAMIAAIGHTDDFQTAADKIVRWGTADASTGGDVWIRFLQPTGEGTRYRILSPEHIFYLVNAFFVMAPATPWFFACLLAIKRGALVADRELRFLLIGLVPLLGYALLIRPVYGPYDWDLFSLTAMWLSFTVAVALARMLPTEAFIELAALAVGLAVLASAVPMIVIGHSARTDRGPFSPELAPPEKGKTFDESFEQRARPWIRPFDP